MSEPEVQAWAPMEVVESLLARAEKSEAERDRLANQLLNEVPESYLQMKARALNAESTIQRVRDVCEQWQNYDAVDWATAPYLLVTDKLTAAKQILQALDGAS